MTRLGTNRSEHPQRLVLGLPNGRGPRAFRGPHVGQGSLLTEPQFVLKIKPQSLGRMRGDKGLPARRPLLQKLGLFDRARLSMPRAWPQIRVLAGYLVWLDAASSRMILSGSML
jgi:hypothetical protein